MKIRTSELTELQLDYLIANIEGRTIRLDPMGFGKQSPGGYWIWEEALSGMGGVLVDKSTYMKIGNKYSPTKRWEQAGPIIDQLEGFELKIWLESSPESKCEAHIHNHQGDWVAFGPTPLVAIMRCIVSRAYGDEVDIPEVLA